VSIARNRGVHAVSRAFGLTILTPSRSGVPVRRGSNRVAENVNLDAGNLDDPHAWRLIQDARLHLFGWEWRVFKE
jgi:hypothetical protein